MYPSPLNYTGGKSKLLPQILPLFPREIHTFVDLFCGGCSVGLNAPCVRVIYHDRDEHLISLYETFLRTDKAQIFAWIREIIRTYGLSMVSENGYAHYHCESGAGLSSFNREPFRKLRADFNARRDRDPYTWVMLYVILVYAFNNQIRFNARGEFNLPVGKRDFNRNMEKKLSAFLDRIREQDCEFVQGDFRAFDVDALSPADFVYADPPYLITCATYNEKDGWNPQAERDLLAFLDHLTARNIRFALSNVLRSKGQENRILLDWLDDHQNQYRAVPLNYSYSNSNYHIKDRQSASEEVLILNYEPPV